MTIIILAAGKGTRMKSEKAKVLHTLHGKPLLKYVINLAYRLKPEKIFVVVGFQRDKIKKYFKLESVEFIDQKEQLGTGHAIMQVKPFLKNCSKEILVLSGDVPLLSESTINEMLDIHKLHNAAITMLTADKADPTGYGRILRNCNNIIEKIIEDKDSTISEKEIKEINAGIYCFDKKLLLEYLEEIKQNNAQQEFYLTDLIKIAIDNSLPVVAVKAKNPDEVKGINTRKELIAAENFLL